MAGARPLLGVAAIVLLAGGIVLQFLVVLSGAVNSSPVNLVYFLQASTDGVSGGRPNLPNPIRWTFFALCGSENGNNANCYPVRAALPFDPQNNFGTEQGVPDALGASKFYYLSRVMFAFYLVALFFAVISFLLSVFALCARLGSYLTGFTVFLALFFQTLTAALMTYVYPLSIKHHKQQATDSTVKQRMDRPGPQRFPPRQSRRSTRHLRLRLHLGRDGRLSRKRCSLLRRRPRRQGSEHDEELVLRA